MLPGMPMGLLAGRSSFVTTMVAGDVISRGFLIGYFNPDGPTATADPEYVTGAMSGAWLPGFGTDLVVFLVAGAKIGISFYSGDASPLLGGDFVDLHINGVPYCTLSVVYDSESDTTQLQSPDGLVLTNPFTPGNTYTLELVPS